MVTVMLVRVVTMIGGQEVTVRVFNGVCYGGLQKSHESIRSGHTFQG